MGRVRLIKKYGKCILYAFNQKIINKAYENYFWSNKKLFRTKKILVFILQLLIISNK